MEKNLIKLYWFLLEQTFTLIRLLREWKLIEWISWKVPLDFTSLIPRQSKYLWYFSYLIHEKGNYFQFRKTLFTSPRAHQNFSVFTFHIADERWICFSLTNEEDFDMSFENFTLFILQIGSKICWCQTSPVWLPEMKLLSKKVKRKKVWKAFFVWVMKCAR